METLEYLIENEFKPRRSFFLAFGHDEEASGFEGAAEMTKIMRSQLTSRVGENDGSLLYLLDEGTVIIREGDGFPGVKDSVALLVLISIKFYVHDSCLCPLQDSLLTLTSSIILCVFLCLRRHSRVLDCSVMTFLGRTNFSQMLSYTCVHKDYHCMGFLPSSSTHPVSVLMFILIKFLSCSCLSTTLCSRFHPV